MKKFIAIVLLLLSASVFANWADVGSFNLGDGSEVSARINPSQNIQINLAHMTLYFSSVEIDKFLQMIEVNLAMVDAVVNNNTTIVYRKQTDRFIFNGSKIVSSRFTTNGSGGEDSCFIRITYIDQTFYPLTDNSVLFSAQELRELVSLINQARGTSNNMGEQILFLEEAYRENRRLGI
jgi:hypothetical protein